MSGSGGCRTGRADTPRPAWEVKARAGSALSPPPIRKPPRKNFPARWNACPESRVLRKCRSLARCNRCGQFWAWPRQRPRPCGAEGVDMLERLFETAVNQSVRKGSLTVTLPDGRTRRYGDGTKPEVAVRITDTDTLRRIVMRPELALGEA